MARRRASRPVDPDARERALDALALMRRERISLTKASQMTHTDRRTVLRHAGQAFRHEGRAGRRVPTTDFLAR